MRRRLAFTAALLGALLVGACKRDSADWRILQLYAGEATLEIVRKPARVQAFPVNANPVAPKPDDVHVGPFVASGARVDASPEIAAELSKILSDADTFDWRRGPKREPIRPQIGLWFVRGADVLEIALDLDTSQMGVFAAGQTLGVQSFDDARPRLVELAKRLLPRDETIRALR